MTTIDIYIGKSVYDADSKTIDTYIVSHCIKTIDYIVCECLTITVSNLCELMTKLGTGLKIRAALFKKNIVITVYDDDSVIEFLYGIFDNLEDACQLVHTVCTVYNIEEDSEFDYSDMVTASFTAKDKNAWRYLHLECEDIATCIANLKFIFEHVADDYHIDATVEYLAKIDKFLNIKPELTKRENECLLECVSWSLINDCPLMRKLIFDAEVAKYMKASLIDVFNAAVHKGFDTADKLLTMVEQEEMQLSPRIFFEQNYGNISLKSVIYMFDLTIDGKVILDEDDITEIAYASLSNENRHMFVYIVTCYPLCINADLVRQTIEYGGKKCAKILKKIMDDNLELFNSI